MIRSGDQAAAPAYMYSPQSSPRRDMRVVVNLHTGAGWVLDRASGARLSHTCSVQLITLHDTNLQWRPYTAVGMWLAGL